MCPMCTILQSSESLCACYRPLLPKLLWREGLQPREGSTVRAKILPKIHTRTLKGCLALVPRSLSHSSTVTQTQTPPHWEHTRAAVAHINLEIKASSLQILGKILDRGKQKGGFGFSLSLSLSLALARALSLSPSLRQQRRCTSRNLSKKFRREYLAARLP